MLKFNILLIFVLFSYNVMAMNNTFECDIKIDFEKSLSSDYLYTGYGELICNDDQTPMTIFSAIRANSTNSSIKNIDTFSLSTSTGKIDVLSYIFQTYKVKTSHNFLFLHFSGGSDFPSRTLSTSIEGTNKLNTLINLLPGSDLIIEQDQFWEDEI